MDLEIKHTRLFTDTLLAHESKVRNIIHEGGSRSSKSISILQYLIYNCLIQNKITCSIIRQSLPTLKASIMRDCIDLLQEMNLYRESNHNKTEHFYKFDNGSRIQFISADDAQKLRGRKHDICYLNEANELTFEVYNQLNMRTKSLMILDYNPSDFDSWIYDMMQNNPDKCNLIKSSYKDNSFLPIEQIKEIEDLINIDENYFRIYALGERPIARSRIYSHFQTVQTIEGELVALGCDFGYNHPTALISLYMNDGKYYIREEIYESYLTTTDLINKMNILNISKSVPIYCDSARPEIIAEIKKAGYKSEAANKQVKEGINTVKSSQIYIQSDSVNILKEYKLYNWKTVNGKIIDEPIKMYDDGLDSIRYALHTYKSKPKNNKFFVSSF